MTETAFVEIHFVVNNSPVVHAGEMFHQQIAELEIQDTSGALVDPPLLVIGDHVTLVKLLVLERLAAGIAN